MQMVRLLLARDDADHDNLRERSRRRRRDDVMGTLFMSVSHLAGVRGDGEGERELEREE